MSKFKIGDRVKWKSQANGSWIEKIGTVVLTLKPNKLYGKRPRAFAGMFKDHIRVFDGQSYFNQTETHYFVEVSTGPNKKPKLYFPRPNSLKAVDDATI